MIEQTSGCQWGEGRGSGNTGIEDEKVLGIKWATGGFPGGAVVENPPANAGDTGSSPGPGRSHTPWSN